MSIVFGEYVLDADSRQLLRSGKPIHITPKAIQLLILLLERRPKAVSKAHIYERLWPDTFVAEVNLATLVFEVRTALGDDAKEPRYVRTVRGLGYAFGGEASEPAAAPPPSSTVHRLVWEDHEVSLRPGENILGRCEEARAWIESSRVSRRHARIMIDGPRATLEDLQSKNGTLLGGRRVDAPMPLRDRDRIEIGGVSLVFRTGSADSTESGN